MSFDIPTKKDFLSLETCEQARDALFLYIRQYVFPNTFNGENDCSLLELAFLENRFSLESFWSQYGEIGQYPNEFKQFCWQIVKENKSQSSGDMLDLVKWSIDTISGELIYYKDKTHEEDADDEDAKRKKEYLAEAQAPFPVMQENENQAIDTREAAIWFEGILNQLNAVQQKRVYVFYLSAINFIAVNASNAPSDMPDVAQELLRKRTKKREGKYGARLSYETKFYILSKNYPLYFEGISWWAVGYEKKYYPHIRDEKARQRLYKQLYREVGFHKTNFNSSRFHKKLADLFIQCLEKGGDFVIEDSFIQKIKKQRPPLQIELKPLPTEAYTARDKMYHALEKSIQVCQAYESVMLWLLRNELGGKTFVVPMEKINQYAVHKSQCAKCQQAEKAMRKVMEYRYSRLQEIMNKPIYPVHKPNNGQISVTTPQKLVQYYEERYKKIPCELHKYYLALAYKHNDEIEKAKALLTSNGTITPSANSTMGTVISVYCACGKEEEYHLNAIRSPKVAIGRLDEENPLVDIPQINICEPDRFVGEDGNKESEMSRNMLTFEYQAEQQDWWVQPNEGKSQEGHLWFLRSDRLFSLLEEGAMPANIDWTKSFERFTGSETLSDIVGIGIFKTSTNISFRGRPLKSIFHPLLGKLPFGWYVEIKAQRRNKTIFKSFAENSQTE